MNNLLQIKNLQVKAEEKTILDGLNLTVNNQSNTVILGPNGSGKSTLANVIAGNTLNYQISGEILFKGHSITEKTPDIRANMGMFLSQQNPTEIPGLTMATFLREAYNAKRIYQKMEKLDNIKFIQLLREEAKKLGVPDILLKRFVNSNFSGGEKKISEMLQMNLLKPQLCILDEIDSGLDVDALKKVGENIRKNQDELNTTFIIITHYPRILSYIKVHDVHILNKGHIVQSGDSELIDIIDKKGYGAFCK